MARRLQGDPRADRRPPVRLTLPAATVLVGCLLGSVAVGAVEVLPKVQEAARDGSALTQFERRHAGGNRLGLDAAPFDAFRADLRRDDRYAVDVPAGARGPFITRGEAIRAYAAFFFLPAIQVGEARRVFRYR